jgi:rubrerythrin
MTDGNGRAKGTPSQPAGKAASENASNAAVPAAPLDAAAVDSKSFQCIFCGALMSGAHCKLMCPNCGYREDCSDLFRA